MCVELVIRHQDIKGRNPVVRVDVRSTLGILPGTVVQIDYGHEHAGGCRPIAAGALKPIREFIGARPSAGRACK